MSMLEFAVAAQTGADQYHAFHATNLPAAEYLVIGLFAAVLGLVALILIRTCARRSSRR